MTRYAALIDGVEGAYGVAFPDAPGCTAMGKTMEEAIANAGRALAEWVGYAVASRLELPNVRSVDELRNDSDVIEQLADGAAIAVVPLVTESGSLVRANLSIDSGLLAAIDEAAGRAGLTRSAFLAGAAKEKLLAGI
jgi:predicted RNase H-like HicB family nuclease